MSDKHLNAQLFELNNGTIRVLLTTMAPPLFPSSSLTNKKGNAPYFGCMWVGLPTESRRGSSPYGIDYSLAVNNGPNSLHGGNRDLTKFVGCCGTKKWGTTIYYIQILMALIVSETRISRRCYCNRYLYTNFLQSMRLDMEAVTKSKSTPVSLAQHTYWNLAGHKSGNVLEHLVQIWGSQITPVDQNSIPTGEFLPVKGTVFDFTSEKKVGSSISEVQGLGYDHNYVLDCGEDKTGLKHAAKVKDPYSSRVLNLWADAPGMQFYTANYVNGVSGKGGAVYERHSGLCFETQGFPNAINQPNFPSIIVHPGEKYKHTMLFEFSVE
ncbi:hypothetical protein GH714_032924 [Hevea brasiliensis]|uniref:Aldose 1-epimerase n=1 Tax=Hevea brasiliensis TaxID=3981 RepID=A0A6A6L4R9_HEVBR|nr:hypothetical protein GH714_032924 [Hevea brasiliensis]